MNVKRIGDHELPVPRRASAGAAGFDLRAAVCTVIGPGGQALVPTGFAWAIPQDFVGIIKDRSSYATARLYTSAGVVDSDYRGEVMVLLRNDGEERVVVEVGDRFAQLLLVALSPITHTHEGPLDETERGEGGFGSTGSE